MHTPITMRTRSIVDELLVHCHGGYEFKPRQRTFYVFYFSILYFYQFVNLFIYLFIDIILNQF